MKRIKILVPALFLIVSMCLLYFPSSAASSEVRWADSFLYEFYYRWHDNMQNVYHDVEMRCNLFEYYSVADVSSATEFSSGEFVFSKQPLPGVPEDTFVTCKVYFLISRFSFSSSDLVFSNSDGVDDWDVVKITDLDLPSEVDFSAYSYKYDPNRTTSYYEMSFTFDAFYGFAISVTENVMQPGVFGFCFGGISFEYSLPDLSDVVSGVEGVNSRLDQIEKTLDDAFNAKITNDKGQNFGDLSDKEYDRFQQVDSVVSNYQQDLDEYLKNANPGAVLGMLKNNILAYSDGFVFWRDTLDAIFDGVPFVTFLFYSSLAVTMFSLIFKISMRGVSNWAVRERSDGASIRRSEKARVQREQREASHERHEDRGSMFDHYGY